MITLIHGDNTEASRNEFLRLKNGETSLDGRTLDASTLVQALEGNLLGPKTVFIERLLTKNPKLVSFLRGDVVLWEDKEVSATILKKLGAVENKLYKIPVLLFKFLDSLSLELYQQLDKPELTHAMLVKRVRHLIEIRDGVTPEGLQDWQASRLTRQARSFTMEKLIALYKQLLIIEVSIKTGMSPLSLQQQTEEMLLSL